jgi:phenylalanyl-tRNA synthetase beta chain
MLVSWNWLKQYVPLDMSHDDLVHRLTMSGLNHEGTEKVDGDRVIDLEVTSNRPDCLGHIGIAREIAVLFELPLTEPEIKLNESDRSVDELLSVKIDAPDLCNRFTARVIEGVKIGPSPDWLLDRLEAIGIKPVNNVVDVTNFVMMECGQPLHAFDADKIDGNQIIVRAAQKGEKLVAIDHTEYELLPGMCVIANPFGAMALGGVMGGADSEISDSTTNVVIEAAQFNSMSIRSTARVLNLHSAASHRFERPVDFGRTEWASRRACQLIQQIAGGEIARGVIDAGQANDQRQPIVLRYAQLRRILGIEIPTVQAKQILQALGCQITDQHDESIVVHVPTWRSDLVREIDLVEEVGRIFGYDQVPDDLPVPMAATIKTQSQRVLDKVRSCLIAAGFDEAMTASLVPQAWSDSFSPWTDNDALSVHQPMLGVLEKASQNIGSVNHLRRSIVPSLLEVRRINEYQSNSDVHLFEIAKVYLANEPGLPDEPIKIGMVSDGDFHHVKGALEAIMHSINPNIQLAAKEYSHAMLNRNRCCQLEIKGTICGFIGEVSNSCAKTFGLRRPATIAEIDMALLQQHAVLIPEFTSFSTYPAVTRDFNFIVDEAVRWAAVQNSVVTAGGQLVESVEYRETFRDEQKDGPGKKRLLLSVTLRSDSSTLTSDQAESTCQLIVKHCQSHHNAQLVG